MVPPDEAFILSTPGSAWVAIVTTDAGTHSFVAMEMSCWESLSGMASEALGFQSSPEGLQRETMVSREGFHVLMNQ